MRILFLIAGCLIGVAAFGQSALDEAVDGRFSMSRTFKKSVDGISAKMLPDAYFVSLTCIH